MDQIAKGLEDGQMELSDLPEEGTAEEQATGLESEDTSGGAEITEPFDPSRIRVEGKQMVMSLLLSRIENREIDLSPSFQRKQGIWTPKAKSQLIESLLIRIPIPAFYMDGTDDNHWLVVDGLQRLSALKAFALDKSMKLSGLEFLKDFEGKKYDQLPRNLQRRIMETEITVFIIQEKTPPDVKFNIFKRINTGGLPLSAQEIRHALNQGTAAELLKRLAESTEFKTATAYGVRDERMGDRECALRFIAFARTPFEQYKSGDLDTFLNQTMRELNRVPSTDIRKMEERFSRAMNACKDVFGDRAFRKQSLSHSRRYPINRALFEVWSVLLESLDDRAIARLIERRSLLAQKFIELLSDSQFEAAISFGTGDPRKVRFRFTAVERIVQEVLE
jgi:hypothetical protein